MVFSLHNMIEPYSKAIPDQTSFDFLLGRVHQGRQSTTPADSRDLPTLRINVTVDPQIRCVKA